MRPSAASASSLHSNPPRCHPLPLLPCTAPQLQDQRAAIEALVDSVAQAPKTRKPTRPTLASKRRRLESKSARSDIKRLRGPGSDLA